MEIFNEVAQAFNDVMIAGNMFVVKLVAFLFILERLLTFLTKLTPWDWDDNIGSILASVVKKMVKR